MTEQLTFALRDTGMALAADAQEIRVPGWNRMALAAIETVARRQPTVHVDDVARYCENWLAPPASGAAWGSVWLAAIRRGYLVRTGEVRPAGGTYRPHAHKHGRAYPVYASKLYAQEDAA
jgi:hypothetical protein